MKTSESIAKIAPALVKAMGAMGGASKDGKNPHFRSSYPTLASAVNACRDILAENGLCAMQDQGGITEHNTVMLTTRIMHTSGEWIETVCEAKPKSFTPQDIGSSITYLRRYGLMTALGIPAEDDDGNTASLSKQQPDVKARQADKPDFAKWIANAVTVDALTTLAEQIKQADVAEAERQELLKRWVEKRASLKAKEAA